MASIRAAFLQITVAVIIAAVSAEDIFHIIEAPTNVDILSCQDSGCQADISDIDTVAAAAALEGPPDHKVPWIGAFGISAKSRPSGIIALVYGMPRQLSIYFVTSYVILLKVLSISIFDLALKI